MLFDDRADAGRQLAQSLAQWRERADVIVLGIPRGGVIVAAEIARDLSAPLDVIICHKLGAPGNSELAIGAVAADGTLYLNDEIVEELRIPHSFIERERHEQLREIKRREELYRQGRPPRAVEGQVVILVDDGIATGATTIAALRALRHQHPARLVLAVPVAPAVMAQPLAAECDEIVILSMPESFAAVGWFYDHFDQVTDEQVVEALTSYSSPLGGEVR